MPESVFTHTIPLLLAGGVCWADGVGVGFGVEAGLLGELAGAAEGAGAGVEAGLELELAGVDEVGELEAEPDAGCEASSEVSDFFLRFFFVVVESAEADELSVLALPEVAAGVEASAAVSLFLERFFLVVVLESVDAELSAVAAPVEASAVSDFFFRFFLVVVVESSAEALVSAL